MRVHSDTAWNIASKFSHVLASETRDLAAHIDIALAAERARCADIAASIDSGRGNEKMIAESIRRLNEK